MQSIDVQNVYFVKMGWAYNTPESAVNNGSHITSVAIVFTAASLLVLSLRFYVRGWMIKTIGAGMYDRLGLDGHS